MSESARARIVAWCGAHAAHAPSTQRLVRSTAADPSGNGEGQTYLGFVEVQTNEDGNAFFQTAVNAPPAGQSIITATATDAANNTSEFSLASGVVVVNSRPVAQPVALGPNEC